MDQILKDGCNDLLALDYETTGLDPFTDKVVGVGIADRNHPAGVYFNLLDAEDSDREYLFSKLAVRKKIAHNVTFEMGFGLGSRGYSYCTKGLVHQIESDWAGVRPNSSLKPLQVSMLQWEYQGDVDLEEWLITNGYTKIVGRDKRVESDKGEMWRAPVQILGHYCCLDAQSTLMLFNEILKPVLKRFPELDTYHSRDFMNLCERVVEQRVKGVYVDRAAILEERGRLELENKELIDKFMNDSIATPHIKDYEDDIIQAHKDKEKLKKDGTKGKAWEKWNAKLQDLQLRRHFDPNSTKLLAWLFYDRLFDTRDWEETDWRGNLIKYMDVETPNGKITVEKTASGKRPMDQDIVPQFGDAGKYLAAYNKNRTILGYMKTMVESLDENDYHHTQLRVNGTKTDRCAGTGGVNIQQLVKHKPYLDCLTPAKGNVFVQMDVDALEPVVIAELSDCKQYDKLYGPTAVRNDVYLFVAASMAAFSAEVRKYYDPENPTTESINAAKKKCKPTRTINKEFHLAAVYGAGAKRIWLTLRKKGIILDLDVVKQMRVDYWRMFKDVKTYEDKLNSIRVANGGFMLGGLSCPISVAESGKKDILNRMIQNTGHKILVKWLYHFEQLRVKSGIDVWPCVVDFHDETVWECKEEDGEAVKELMRKTWDLTNAELGGTIRLTGEPMICHSFSAFKCED